MSDVSLSLVNVWTDEQPGSGGYIPMTASLLWLPETHVIGQPAPAFLFLHRWGGYPYDSLPASLGPQMAERGFAFLSLCLRRRGMEGQLTAMPDNDLHDIKLALDYLHTNGFRRVFLVGEELGCLSALNYMSRHADRRVAGLALIDAVPVLARWLEDGVGDAEYANAVRLASLAARQGAGMDTRIDLFPDNGPAITQQAMAFLAWWGGGTPDPDALRGQVAVPLLELDGSRGDIPDDLTGFAQKAGINQNPAPPLELVHTDSSGKRLFGLHWRPAGSTTGRTAVLLVHGLTSSPLSSLFGQLGPRLAQEGLPTLAVELRRSGWAGHETALLEWDTDDIDCWMDALRAWGFERIVLAGASIGSLSVGRYQSVRQHSAVAGIAHLMPTADCPDWFRAAAGEGPYREAVTQAESAVAAGRGSVELIDIDIRQPPPNKYGGRFRWTQRAASWLSWWGPDADSRNSVHIAAARVPLLLLSGTEDSYNDPARFAELKAAAVSAPRVDEIWYDDIDHGLAGAEERTAVDLVDWIRTLDD